MFQEKFSLETPEHVPVEFEVAGPMSRFAAALIDGILVLCGLLALTLVLLLASLAIPGIQEGGDVLLAVAIVVVGLLVLGYFPLFEHFWKGQTPGKRALGIRVMRRDMAPLDFTSVFLRGILRTVDALPGLPVPLVGLVTMTISEQGLRLGDLVGGTWVVRDPDVGPLLDGFGGSAVRHRPRRPAKGAEVPVEGARLTPEEFRIAREFLERAPSLDQAQRRAAAVRISGPILRRLGEHRLDAEAFLREEVGKGSAGRSLL